MTVTIYRAWYALLLIWASHEMSLRGIALDAQVRATVGTAHDWAILHAIFYLALGTGFLLWGIWHGATWAVAVYEEFRDGW